METPEQCVKSFRYLRRSGVFIVNVEQISHIVLFPLFPLNRQIPARLLLLVAFYALWNVRKAEAFSR